MVGFKNLGGGGFVSQGGARIRSGPPSNPDSLRSKKRGVKFVVLDAEGYKGVVPKFPLPRLPIYMQGDEGSRVDERATRARRRREESLWVWAWSQPQGIAWARESWRHYSVALWVRTAVICESAESTAADKQALHRFADQIGITPEGLARNGWQIGVPEPVEVEGEPVVRRSGVRGRFEVIENAG